MKKRTYRQKRKIDYMLECDTLKREVERLSFLVAANNKLKLQGMMQAFEYTITEFEIAESPDRFLLKIRDFMRETQIDIDALQVSE